MSSRSTKGAKKDKGLGVSQQYPVALSIKKVSLGALHRQKLQEGPEPVPV